jgi:hypothetical protein
MVTQPFERRRLLRGAPYSLMEFKSKYGLDASTAEDLFVRFGPSSIELDLLMSAKRQKPTITALTMDMAPEAAGETGRRVDAG